MAEQTHTLAVDYSWVLKQLAEDDRARRTRFRHRLSAPQWEALVILKVDYAEAIANLVKDDEVQYRRFFVIPETLPLPDFGYTQFMEEVMAQFGVPEGLFAGISFTSTPRTPAV